MSSHDPGRYSPSRRDLFRPLELLGLSAVVGAAVGIVVFISTRAFEVAVIFAGLSFIITLVVLAMLALTAKPDGAERTDIREQDGKPDASPGDGLDHDPGASAGHDSGEGTDRGH